MANQSRRRKYHFFCSPTFVSLISSCNLSEVHLTLLSFGVTPVKILRCFTKAKEMVNRRSRDEKLGAREPYRLNLAIIKTSTEGPFTCRMNSFKSWFHGWNMKGAVSCVPASLNQHPRVRKKTKSASPWSITTSETGEIIFSTVYSCIQKNVLLRREAELYIMDFSACPFFFFFYKFLCHFNHVSCGSPMRLQNFSLICLLSYFKLFWKTAAW